MLTFYVNNFLQDKIWLTPLLKYPQFFKWTKSPEHADFLVLECPYEVIYDYSSEEYLLYGIQPSEIKLLQDSFQSLKEISAKTNKKIIIFYYRDSSSPLEIPNSIIYRTSIDKINKEKLTFSMPAFISKSDESYLIENSDFRSKERKPIVTFRGQHASLKLPASTEIRLLANSILNGMGFRYRVNTFIPQGYLARRNAIKSLLNSNDIEFDYLSVTWEEQKFNSQLYKGSYLESLIKSNYVVCSAGFGNYSFRFYETLAAGRIPIFINTNSELPFENIIDWKNITVWCEYDESRHVNSVSSKLLQFHRTISTQGFLEHQEKLKKIYKNYLSMEGFCLNIFETLYQLIN
ncbi:MAG: glycosyltransferase family 47 protein [Thermosynechococcaceae cyanobacterium MS004]|nr:glycosyltransferase family 47 protein [Thermosynechococcaceae cyanobacterium MS004]